jgi:hypothetical protein
MRIQCQGFTAWTYLFFTRELVLGEGVDEVDDDGEEW